MNFGAGATIYYYVLVAVMLAVTGFFQWFIGIPMVGSLLAMLLVAIAIFAIRIEEIISEIRDNLIPESDSDSKSE